MPSSPGHGCKNLVLLCGTLRQQLSEIQEGRTVGEQLAPTSPPSPAACPSSSFIVKMEEERGDKLERHGHGSRIKRTPAELLSAVLAAPRAQGRRMWPPTS